MPDLTQFSNVTLFVMLVTLSVCVGMCVAFLVMRQVDRLLDKPEVVAKPKRKRRTKAQVAAAKQGDATVSIGQAAREPRTGAAKTATRIGQTTGSGSSANVAE